MLQTVTNHRALLLAVLLASIGSGCTMMRAAREAVVRNQADDVHPQRERRKAEVVKQFDQKRDEAQFDAAVTRWEQGSAEESQKMLEQLLERNPNHLRGQLLLADVYLFRGNLDAALGQLERAAMANPDNAMVRHSLAQVLDALGRHDEALTHYERAVQLDPHSELYTLSYHTARETSGAQEISGVALASGKSDR